MDVPPQAVVGATHWSTGTSLPNSLTSTHTQAHRDTHIYSTVPVDVHNCHISQYYFYVSPKFPFFLQKMRDGCMYNRLNMCNKELLVWLCVQRGSCLGEKKARCITVEWMHVWMRLNVGVFTVQTLLLCLLRELSALCQGFAPLAWPPRALLICLSLGWEKLVNKQTQAEWLHIDFLHTDWGKSFMLSAKLRS